MIKKKLVIIYWNLGIGGIQKRIRDIVLDISEKKPEWETYILLRSRLKESFEEQIPRSGNIHVVIYPFDKQKVRPPAGFAFWLLFKYTQLRPNVCMTFLPYLALTLLVIRRVIFWTRTAIVINEGVVLTTYLTFRDMVWLKPIIQRIYNMADRIIVPTQACQRDLCTQLHIHRSRISVVPNWTLLKKTIPLQHTYDILYVGRFDAEKQVLSVCDIVLQVKRRFPNVTALLMGSGELVLPMYKRIAANRLENNITIESFHANTLPYMRKSKLLLLPSMSEGMPNVVLEAGMCQVPAVINKFSGAEAVVRHGQTGYVARSPEEMQKHIEFLLSHERQRRQMGRQVQQYVSDNFGYSTQQRFIKQLLLE
jgi:glycosyltransferase involved in cell wall biosynthesis